MRVIWRRLAPSSTHSILSATFFCAPSAMWCICCRPIAWARSYMGRLDAEIARELVSAASVLPYLYMSLIVELRAIWTYHLYQTVLTEQNAGFQLKSVLAEEELHLSAMMARLTDMDANVAA